MIAGGGFVDAVSLTCHIFGLLAGAMMGLVVPDYLSVNENATPEGGV
jgi:Na+/glutamate symporter